MSLFIETIKVINGRRINLEGHSKRMNATRNRHFHEIRNIDLKDVLEIPEERKKGLIKCRVTYGRKIEKIEYERYSYRNPRSFKLVNADHIDYQYKYQDRYELTDLYDNRGEADDILMIKNGLLTDSFYANVAVLKNGTWYTPNIPMLKGTFREKLLSKNKIVPSDITPSQIFEYEKVKIINAMIEWSGHPAVNIEKGTIFY